MPSPLCTVNGGATANGVDVAANSVITIALIDTANVRTWAITCVGQDEASSALAISVDSVTKTATATVYGSTGAAYIFESVVNGGVDNNGKIQASYRTRFAVYVKPANGLRLIALGEGTEGKTTFGWIAQINAFLRAYEIGFDVYGNIRFGADLVSPYILQTNKSAASASQPGQQLSFRAQDAVAGTVTNGAAIGGTLAFISGNAARRVSGDGDGGGVTWSLGDSVGNGSHGTFVISAQDLTSPHNGTPIFRVVAKNGDYALTVTSEGLYSDSSILSLGGYEFDVLAGQLARYNATSKVTAALGGPSGSGTTTDGITPATLLTVPTTTNTAGVLHVTAFARRTSDNQVQCFTCDIAWKNVAGTLTVGSPLQLLGAAGQITLSGCVVGATNSGTDITVRGVGLAATTITWGATYKNDSQGW